MLTRESAIIAGVFYRLYVLLLMDRNCDDFAPGRRRSVPMLENAKATK